MVSSPTNAVSVSSDTCRPGAASGHGFAANMKCTSPWSATARSHSAGTVHWAFRYGMSSTA